MEYGGDDHREGGEDALAVVRAGEPERRSAVVADLHPEEGVGRAAGVAVGLGTDGEKENNNLDMFEAMRQAAFLHKLTSGDPRTLPAAVVPVAAPSTSKASSTNKPRSRKRSSERARSTVPRSR